MASCCAAERAASWAAVLQLTLPRHSSPARGFSRGCRTALTGPDTLVMLRRPAAVQLPSTCWLSCARRSLRWARCWPMWVLAAGLGAGRLIGFDRVCCGGDCITRVAIALQCTHMLCAARRKSRLGRRATWRSVLARHAAAAAGVLSLVGCRIRTLGAACRARAGRDRPCTPA